MTLSFWWQDAQRALRFLGPHPLFALGVILVLAIGIGPVAVLSSLMHVAFLRPWQVPDPDGLAIFRARSAAGEVYGEISIAEYRFLREHSRSLSHIAASRSAAVSVDDGSGRQVRLNSVSVSADYFDALLVGMTLGRGFVADEEDYGAPKAVAIIGHHLWRTHFDSDPAIIGRTVLFGRQNFVLVGVAPRGFAGVESRAGRRTDVWMPLPAGALLRGASPDLAQFADPRGTGLGLVAGRLSAGATRASAAAEMSVLSRQFRSAAALPSAGFEAIDTRPMSRWPPGFLGSTLPLQALLALTVILMLVLACMNAGNLLLARAMSRRHEIAIHLSLGATRVRVVRQLLMEAAVLSTLAGTLGLGLAFAAPRLIVGLGFGYSADGFYRMTSPDQVELSHYAPDALVFWLALGLVSVTAVVAGLAPALQATRDTLTSLSADRHGSTATGSRWRNGLLVAQIAVTTVLLVGAGLLTRGIGHAAALNPGFAIKDVQVVSVQPKIPPAAMSTRGKAFFTGLRDALQNSDPGSVAFADEPPFWDVNLVMNARRPESPGTIQQILMRRVSRDYFGVLAIPIVKGRIPDSDTEPREIVVNEAAARALWAGADPIGRTLESAISRTEFQPYIVVGIAKNVPVRSMSEIEPVIYRTPDWMPADWTATLLVRDSPPGLGQRVRAVAASLEPQVTVAERPLVDYVRDSLTTAALASRVAWAIGALGLVLAMVGAFGVFAQAAEARRREIGIRMALGSSRAQIAWLALLTASKALAWGVAVGYLLSLMSVPILRRFLYGLSPFDPVAYAGVAGILMLAGAVATWIPVRRAMVVDPATALRSE
jgi:putative ABC transport system permease protein